jgi:hypothetical protein
MIELNTITTGDALGLGQDVPDSSVDLIFTDPPYARASLPLYAWLAEFAARVLRTGGFCLAMGGGLFTPDILAAMGAHLKYYQILQVALSDSAGCKLFPNGEQMPVIARTKPIYTFSKGRGKPRTVIYTPFTGSGNDKRFHHWGQEEQSIRYFIDCIVQAPAVVCDPFMGGGTTAAVCQMLGLDYFGFEIDETTAHNARQRLKNPLYTPEQESGQLRFGFVK